MTIRELLKRLMEANTDLDDEALARIITRDKDNCVIDAEIAPVRHLMLNGTMCVEKRELLPDLR